jgi:hypothetical protein
LVSGRCSAATRKALTPNSLLTGKLTGLALIAATAPKTDATLRREQLSRGSGSNARQRPVDENPYRRNTFGTFAQREDIRWMKMGWMKLHKQCCLTLHKQCCLTLMAL